ncbi:MAG: chromosome segregation protein SMC [Phycisphaerae bacterium]|nr:chromosome segregation protein SMC [Phycisphaerae bacterium]
MFLKHLNICGFKSFADKVEFDFGPGITCIVGPNGCGKSNVVDAFRWVLGEQSAKSLRGRQMLDMIFNGAENRRSAGMAQIEVVFDNRDHMLPMDCDEVSVMRKLFRSGESEYLLNRKPARLKDVRELFMDTGVATEAYSVIEQGKVDALLQANPLERRVIFEEAAGISRYKARRHEAERKLERTQQNLLRLGDIIEEVERRLRSVKLQAGKARNFQAYETQLRELRARFSMAEYHRLSGEISRYDTLVGDDTDRGVKIRTRIDRDETGITRLGTDADRINEQLTDAENQVVRVTSEVSGLEERVEATQRRIVEQAENLDKAYARRNQCRERITGLTDEIHQLEQQAQELEQQALAQRETIDALNQQDQSLARDLTQAQAILEDIKSGIIELLRRTSRLHNEITTLERHAETLTGQKGRLNDRDAEIARELKDLLQTRASFEARISELDEVIEAETIRLAEKKADASRVEQMRLELADALARLKEERSGLISRRQLLHDLEDRMEGVGAAVRKLLKGRLSTPNDGALSTIEGIVADLFDVDVEHAATLEAALGEFDQLLVVNDSRRFLSDAALLEDLPGRLTVVFLDRLPPVVNVRDFSIYPGYVAQVLEFVRFSDPLEHLAKHLLGKTIVVQSLDEALAMAEKDTEGHRFVTLGGELVEPGGCISLGPASGQVGLISRKSELRGIDDRIEGMVRKIERVEDQLNRTTAEAGHLAQVQQELRTSIYEANTAKVEANAAMQNVSESIRRLSNEQPLIANELDSLARQIAEAGNKRSANRDDLGRLDEEKSAREQEVAQYQQKIDDIVAQRERLAARSTEARVADGQLSTKRAAAVEAVNKLRHTLREAQEGIAAATHEAADCEGRIAESETVVLQGREKLTELCWDCERLQAEALQLRRMRDLLRLENDELTTGIKQLRTELDEVEARLHANQMELSTLGVRREDLVARVADELGIDLAQAYESYEHAEEDWGAVEAQIAELRLKMDRLGNVNLDAITEQDELEQRLEFLTSQRSDLDESHKQLQQLIDRLNHECLARFTEAFAVIRENFQDLFRKLFGGGKADIILEDPDNPLECGIEIMVRPPGKELQSLLLLSGGEKSMTAIALVMSIFRSRPAPFTILDEVDAALDEANNVRFNNIVLEFLDRSQFIVITHSKRTMSIANRMYGVTMQEPGVSSLVSVKFEQDVSDTSEVEGAVA